MAIATALARKPDKRRGATTTVRPSTEYFNNGTATDSAIALRRQCLARLGIAGIRADLVAALAWADGGNDRVGGFA